MVKLDKNTYELGFCFQHLRFEVSTVDGKHGHVIAANETQATVKMCSGHQVLIDSTERFASEVASLKDDPEEFVRVLLCSPVHAGLNMAVSSFALAARAGADVSFIERILPSLNAFATEVAETWGELAKKIVQDHRDSQASCSNTARGSDEMKKVAEAIGNMEAASFDFSKSWSNN